ncbi:protein-L-isoaspartate O-methyltransferase [Hyaloraphidium curvatum]|nr:protein-L-isoaspartate O-methyltransferase [Hyaloraphidium curvatum]
MAWRCSGATNAELVANLAKAGIIRSPTVENAMLAIDRRHYVRQGDPYFDSPQTIGYGATISAPHMHAYMLEELKNHLKPGMSALDVGSGSGYLAACMAEMVGPTGRIIGVDHIQELVDLSHKNVERDKPEFLRDGRLKFFVGDGRQGWKDGAPFDAIHVGAAAPQIPKALIEQLKPGGSLLIPVGTYVQELVRVDRHADGSVHKHHLMGVQFVPLTDAEHQRSRGF